MEYDANNMYNQGGLPDPEDDFWGIQGGSFWCWFSKRFWDIHDYPKNKGGDGIPTHFHEYTCHMCGKKFGI